jgi:hypothetical protein
MHGSRKHGPGYGRPTGQSEMISANQVDPDVQPPGSPSSSQPGRCGSLSAAGRRTRRLQDPASDPQGPANDLQDPANDLQDPANDPRVRVSDLQVSASDLQVSASDLQVSASDLQVSASDLQVSASDLQPAHVDPAARAWPSPNCAARRSGPTRAQRNRA